MESGQRLGQGQGEMGCLLCTTSRSKNWDATPWLCQITSVKMPPSSQLLRRWSTLPTPRSVPDALGQFWTQACFLVVALFSEAGTVSCRQQQAEGRPPPPESE